MGGREEGVGALSADVLMFLDFDFDLLKLVCPDSPFCLHFFLLLPPPPPPSFLSACFCTYTGSAVPNSCQAIFGLVYLFLFCAGLFLNYARNSKINGMITA